jgi:hypothetical protein
MSDHAFRRLTLAILVAACAGHACAAAATYVVSSARGKDTNPGTNAAPWRTINKAANAATPGSTVLIEGGIYTERVSVHVSGNAIHGPITFTPKPGQSVILRSPGTIYSADGLPVGLIDIRGRAYLTISGLEIENYYGVNANTFPAGIAIVGSGDHITLSHNHVHNIEGSRNGLFDAHGIAVYGASPVGVTNVIIDGNEVDHLKLGQSESVVINGNVSGWQVTKNRVHDNDNIGIDAIGFEGTASNPKLDQARNGLIAGNQVFNIDSNLNPTYGPNSNAADGIYIDGGTHIIIERNLVYHTDIAVEMASEHKGQTTSFVIARNNLLYFNYGPAISLGGYDPLRGWSSHITVVNNTLFANDSRKLGGGDIQLQFWPKTAPIDNQFANNMVCPNSQAIVLSSSLTRLPPVRFDHDLYCSRYPALSWTWAGAERLGLAAFRAASGQEGHGLNKDPLFVSQTLPNLQTLPGSPARGAGVNLGAAVVGALDYAGSPRTTGASIDIGAYQAK